MPDAGGPIEPRRLGLVLGVNNFSKILDPVDEELGDLPSHYRRRYASLSTGMSGYKPLRLLALYLIAPSGADNRPYTTTTY